MGAKQKGKNGEQEACDWLARRLFDNKRKLVPNSNQTKQGKRWDIDAKPFAIEVKRRETLTLAKWWIQVKKAVDDRPLIPVVMFRQNRGEWEFLISASTIGVDSGFIRISSTVFVRWARTYLGGG